jgi:WD40 repeat protein
VFPSYEFKRFDNNLNLIMGHKGNVTDCAFSPFNKNLLATTAEDGLCKLWLIGDEGLTENVMEADASL